MPVFEVVTVRLTQLAMSQALMTTIGQLAQDHRAYLLAYVGGHAQQAGRRRLGRSAPIAAQDTVDLTAERMVWEHEVAVAQGEAVDVRAEVWADRIDAAPQRLWELDVSIASPWTPGQADGVASGTTLRYEVERTGAAVVQQQPQVAIAPGNANVNQNAVVLRPKLVVTIADVLGLYKPAVVNPGAVPAGAALPALATRVQGYASEDHRGRIFIDRLPNGDWERGTQYIDVTARITGLDPLQPLQPDDIRIRWTVFVPDDPTDDDPAVHRDAGSLLDPDDYDAQGVPLGAAGYDNEGTNALYTQNTHVWEQIDPHVLTPRAAAAAVGVTTVVNAKNAVYLKPATTTVEVDANDDDVATSAVRVHCPGVGGDRLVVRAEIVTEIDVQALRAQTGIMSMWKRIDVQYRQMQRAVPLSIASIPQHFEPAFAQLDFTVGNAINDTNPLPPSDFDVFLQTNFTRRTTAGWFCLIAASRASVQPGVVPPRLYQGEARLWRAGVDLDVLNGSAGSAATKTNGGMQCTQHEYVDLPGNLGAAFKIELVDQALSVSFDFCQPTVVTLAALATAAGLLQRLHLLGYDVGAFQMQGNDYPQPAKNAIRDFVTDVNLVFPPQATVPEKGRLTRERVDKEFQAWGRHSKGYAALTQQEQQVIDAAIGQYDKATRLWICPHDVQNKFTAGAGDDSGALTHAYHRRTFYGPRFRERVTGANQDDISQDGYGFPEWPTATVHKKLGALKGQSPDGQYQAAKYFAGQTIVFTHHSGYVVDPTVDPVVAKGTFGAETVIACVHELTHAFGMPHKCGSWNTAAPRGTTCCMNYPPNWMVDAQDELTAGTAGNIGPALCARHAKEMRRVMLGDNPVLKARGW